MRSLTLHASALALLLLTAGWTCADDDTKAILDKAIKAHGSADKDKKASQTKSKGTVEVMGVSINFNEDSTAQPNRFKSVTTLEVSGKTIEKITVFNGEKAWVRVMDQTRDVDGKALEELKELTYLKQLADFRSLMEKPYELSSLGELKVNERPAVGVKVANKGHRDVNLWFDKETGLLAKVERQGVDSITEREFTEERIVTEYQEQDGIKVPKRAVVYRDGKKYMDLEVLEYKRIDKLADSEFAKP